MRIVTPCFVVALSAASAGQTVLVEDFEGSNDGELAFTTPNATLQPTGGNGGAYLDSGLVAQPYFGGLALDAQSSVSFLFGNYRQRGVTQLSFDVRVDSNPTLADYPLTLTLTSGMAIGGGGSVSVTHPDDAPDVGTGWRTYTFDVPSQNVGLPAGWDWGGPNAQAAWELAITNVTDVRLAFEAPGVLLAPYDDYQVAIDNVTLTEDPGDSFCHGDGGAQAGCTDCPCGNALAPGSRRGCANSSGLGARLVRGGNGSDQYDTLRMRMTDGAPSSFGVLVSAANLLPQVGPCPAGSGIQSPVFDGLRCIGGRLFRHGARATDAGGAIGLTNPAWGVFDPPTEGLMDQGAFVVGEVRHFQIFYTDDPSLVCGSGANTTNAITVVFAP